MSRGARRKPEQAMVLKVRDDEEPADQVREPWSPALSWKDLFLYPSARREASSAMERLIQAL